MALLKYKLLPAMMGWGWWNVEKHGFNQELGFSETMKGAEQAAKSAGFKVYEVEGEAIYAEKSTLQNLRLEFVDTWNTFAWLDLETKGYKILMGLTHKTVGDAKAEAIKQGYTIKEGEQGVFAQKEG